MAANVQEGKLTHFTMKRSTDGSPETTEEAWVDPQRLLVRYQHPGDAPGAAPVTEVAAFDTASPDMPVGPMVVLAGSTASVPPSLQMQNDELDGQPVVVVSWEVPGSEAGPSTNSTLVFDRDYHLLTETHASAGSTTRISYTTDFVDPASLPADAFDTGEVPPPDTDMVRPTVPTPESMTAEAERAVKLGLDLRWLGTSSGGWQLADLSVDTGVAIETVPLSASLMYEPTPGSGLPEGALQITATTPAGWPALQQLRSELPNAEAAGKPVPGIGQRAFILTSAMPAVTQSTMVVFFDDAVLQLDLFGVGAQAADVEAAVLAVGKALHRVSGG